MTYLYGPSEPIKPFIVARYEGVEFVGKHEVEAEGYFSESLQSHTEVVFYDTKPVIKIFGKMIRKVIPKFSIHVARTETSVINIKM